MGESLSRRSGVIPAVVGCCWRAGRTEATQPTASRRMGRVVPPIRSAS